jgi:RNA polymerase sigma-70 factor (ECF subfamily)
MSEISDIEILEMFKQASKKELAFGELVKKFKKPIYWHVRRIVISHDDADDVVQNVFVKIWKSLADFRGDSKLLTWILKIATNESLTFLKIKRRKLMISFSTVEEYLKNNLESDAYFSGDEMQLKLQKALLTLPEKQRIVFNMKYFDEMKYEEMSEILDTSVGALKASFHLATKKIEEFLKRD